MDREAWKATITGARRESDMLAHKQQQKKVYYKVNRTFIYIYSLAV